MKAFLLSPFLTQAVILYRQAFTADLFKTLAKNISELETDVSSDTHDSGEDDESGEEDDMASNEKKAAETVVRKDTYDSTENCDNILKFLQVVVEKVPNVAASPI